MAEEIEFTSKDRLLLQNARFYEAFENSDVQTLDSIWSHAASAKCIHPGWHILEGWKLIRESWEGICSSGPAMKISLRNIKAEIHGNLGIVTLIEEITYASETEVRTGAVVATNIFEYIGNEWKMIHHHGSPVVPTREKHVDDSFRYN